MCLNRVWNKFGLMLTTMLWMSLGFQTFRENIQKHWPVFQYFEWQVQGVLHFELNVSPDVDLLV
jgi:hypothetical protein